MGPAEPFGKEPDDLFGYRQTAGCAPKKLGLKAGSVAAAFYWVDVPSDGNGADDAAAQNISTRLEKIIENPHLRYLCSWILGLGQDGGAFLACIDNVIASADQRVPDDDPGVSVLVGRPLAVVRASLQFETPGLASSPAEVAWSPSSRRAY